MLAPTGFLGKRGQDVRQVPPTTPLTPGESPGFAGSTGAIGLSPLVAVLALLGLIFGVLALALGAIQNRPQRRRNILAASSLLLLVVFPGISNALYSPSTTDQGSTPEPRETTVEEDPRDKEAGKEKIAKATVEPMRATYYGEEFAGAPTASGETIQTASRLPTHICRSAPNSW